MIDYLLIRSRRRTIAIHITKEAAVEVRAPLNAPKRAIDGFVASKEEWIAENVSRRSRLLEEKSAFTLNYGSRVALLGGEYPVEASGFRSRFDGSRFIIPANLPPEEIKRAVVLVYKLLAKEIFNEKVTYFSGIMGVSPRSVRVSSAKTRWGSCSGVNGVTFSWLLLMADAEAVDYVVVHELAHILEHNHSPRFWAAVARIFPDYAERRKSLKALHAKLATEDWDI